jgi:cytochrome c-type biogenesis protein
MGVAFAFGWTPCVGPILASILTMAAQGNDPAGGALLLFVYSLGMGIPFLISGLFVGFALRAFARVRRHLRVIQILCGAILIVYGALLISGQFTWLSARLSGLGL